MTRHDPEGGPSARLQVRTKDPEVHGPGMGFALIIQIAQPFQMIVEVENPGCLTICRSLVSARSVTHFQPTQAR